MDGAGPELGDLRLITLTWSPVVLGCGETGAVSLVETPFSSFALPAFPEEAPRSVHSDPSRSHSEEGSHRGKEVPTAGSDSLMDCLPGRQTSRWCHSLLNLTTPYTPPTSG